ncbi:MAG TPA: polysaccharide deacetylase family protein [candidate division Zixibacteria bacterium]|nr:polysaccharide deacetylase family protein [candidate division Zixibacteria bacterium]
MNELTFRTNPLLLAALLFVVALVASFSSASADKNKSSDKKTRSICITFDQLPVDQSFSEIDHTAVVTSILEALKKHEAKAAGFVVAERIGNDFDLLGQWLNEGHVLGNLTYSHQDIDEIGIEHFISEIAACEEALEPMLSGFGQKKRYFRYPYLHYGSTVEAKRAVGDYLAANEITVAHATVLVEDYLYNLSLEKLGSTPDSIDIDLIGSQYLQHVMEQVTAAEQLATRVLHRDARHILQLRSNQLNALVLDELLTALEERGYQFINLDKALKDDLYQAPEAYFGGPGVSYIEMIMESNPDFLPAR